MNLGSEQELKKAYSLLEDFDLDGARDVLSLALVEDLDSQEIMFNLKVLSFWREQKQNAFACQDSYTCAEMLIQSWKKFMELFSAECNQHEQSVYSIQKGVFTFALGLYQKILQNASSAQKAIFFARIGLCYKILGDYETAISFLQEANSAKQNDSEILAYMADCYALCGNGNDAKILFREAFFINAQNVDVTLIESELFCALYKVVAQKHKTPQEIAEWIPVEGVIMHVFDCTRELRAIEIGHLKQDIYALENELKNSGCQKELITPRLINKYFWLIDHYLRTNEDHSKINEILLKIKLLDEDIYQRYTV